MRSHRSALFVVVVGLLSFLAEVFPGLAFHCGPCQPELCELPEDCPGGLGLDPCQCCLECARIVNQTCGGKHGFLGRCDSGLRCTIQPDNGQAITGHEEGICTICEQQYHGCSVLDGVCICGVSCEAPYTYSSRDTCEIARTTENTVSSGDAEGDVDCASEKCDIVFMPECPDDSVLVGGHITAGHCCPEPQSCQCNPLHCLEPICARHERKILVAQGTGSPGACCDVYQCRPEDSKCSHITCPDSDTDPLLAECPSDSYALPKLLTHNGCCEEPQGCECKPCPTIQCPDGLKIQPLSPLPHLGQPGDCCKKYSCVNSSDMVCVREDRVYKNGEQWQKDRCTTCTCKNGLMFCRAMAHSCPVPVDSCSWMVVPEGECCPVCKGCIGKDGNRYANGELWEEDAGCTMCRCESGQRHCQASLCRITCANPKKVEGQCCPVCEEAYVTLPPHCPSLMNCSLRCPNGLIQDDQGCYLCQCKPDECHLQCPFGYKRDRHTGRDKCECLIPHRKCPSLENCTKHCVYGYKVTKEGCLKCRCNKCPPFSCQKICPYGYELNNKACKLCKCKGAPTSSPTPVTVSTTSVSPSGHSLRCMSSQGHLFSGGESWYDGCRTCYCHGGREMCSLITCPVPRCQHPIIRVGDCCPTCTDVPSSPNPTGQSVCRMSDDQYHNEGETWYLDQCTLCICHNGAVLCEVESCPPLLCHNPVKLPNKCCAVCPDDQALVPVVTAKKHCSTRSGATYNHGEIWKAGPCQSCTCRHGQIHCFYQTCLPLTCNETVLKKGQCCPHCSDAVYPGKCEEDGNVYADGVSWQRDPCTTCVCNKGKALCNKMTCPALNCPESTQPVDKCCPECLMFPEPGQREGHLVTIGILVAIILILALLLLALAVVIARYRRRSARSAKPKIENYTFTDNKKRPKSTNLDLQGGDPMINSMQFGLKGLELEPGETKKIPLDHCVPEKKAVKVDINEKKDSDEQLHRLSVGDKSLYQV